MKTYKVTFGTGSEAVTVIEENCCSFAEAIIRIEYTGFDVTAITKVESEITD